MEVQNRAVGAVVVDPKAIPQHPEVVPMHVEGVLLLSRPVGSHSSPTVIAACPGGPQLRTPTHAQLMLQTLAS